MADEPRYHFREAADGTIGYVPAGPAGPGIHRGWFIAGFLAICVLLGAGVAALGGGDPAASSSPAMAQLACRDFVKDRLVSPASARFSATSSAGSGPVTVTGVVDSDNAFGAALRSTYACTVVDLGSAGWHLQAIQVS